ncbi:TrpB-like pyridoxal phosphate-dependent enzyme [Streptomyces sp. NPDC057746]|uniref:TrpB-like pyridoxal phosphate-dependent enzyme n=1 Tax=Streptomyces sp. NPDC057746 TaxID=3346237 RepID=UPI00369ED24D
MSGESRPAPGAMTPGPDWNPTRVVPSSAPDDVPEAWFNLVPNLPIPLPPARDGGDGQPSRLALQRRIRLAAVQEQDASTESFLPVPQRVREELAAIGRPTPLLRARALEAHLQTPARIYLKREDMLPTGSFKLNSAIAQAYFAAQQGVRTLVTETGAGQWGHAVAWAARLFGLHAVIFWAGVSARQKPGRHTVIKLLGGEVYPSPSERTQVGKALLRDGRHLLGSLGTAIGEAISYAQDHPETRYISGSNLPHVLAHQSVIGQEVKAQLAALGETPDTLIACVGGGSNLGGLMGPYLADKAERGDGLKLIGAESASAPRLTRGEWRYDHADPEGITPLTKSYTLGRDYELPETHVGGLRQHSGSAVVGVLRSQGLIDAVAYKETEAFETGSLMLRHEGILIAPESCHAVRAAVDRAIEARRTGHAETIVACVSGNGALDLEGYTAHLGDGA